MANSAAADPALLSVDAADGLRWTARLRRSAQARRLTLRFDPADGIFVLTLPMGAPLALAQHFLRQHTGWMARQALRAPDDRPFAPGAHAPYLGDPHRLTHEPSAGPPVERRAETNELVVRGRPEHFSRRVTDWLRARAVAEITPRAAAYAARLDRPPPPVRCRDTRSRWGSCSSAGSLSFNWRLVMAPAWVLDYVVAHEAAHLREMNHSPRFWRLVAELGVDAAAGRDWLKRHGPELHRYGASAR